MASRRFFLFCSYTCYCTVISIIGGTIRFTFILLVKACVFPVALSYVSSGSKDFQLRNGSYGKIFSISIVVVSVVQSEMGR